MDLREIDKKNQFRHPWEIIRSEFILNEIKKSKINRVIDIGSGDGYIGKKIQQDLKLPVLYVDNSFSEKMLEEQNHFSSIDEISFVPGDLILLADVLEHIEFPDQFLQELKSKLVKGTIVVITVPTFQFLFSEHDKFLGHFRRYSKEQLLQLTEKNLKLNSCHYFFFLPLIVRWIQVFFGFSLKTTSVSSWRFPQSHFLTRFILFIFRLDLYLFKPLPGLSLYFKGTIQ